MYKEKLLLFIIYIGSLPCNVRAQDTVILHEISIRSYFSPRPLLTLPASAAIIDSSILKESVTPDLVHSVNTISGVRMEERSPGSYRLSIRGSLVRSPFGIRNVKIYIEDLPLTDGGGNTYLNLIDIASISSIELLKGPDGSLFGANSGGVVRLAAVNENDSALFEGATSYGSYHTSHAAVSTQLPFKKDRLHLLAAWMHSDGYRENSALTRKYLQLHNSYQYSAAGTLRLLLLFSDLSYQTPGGLTLSQYENDPHAARPSTAFLPGASQQQAAVFNKTLYGGVTNELQMSHRVKHILSFYGSYTDFKNPFITNYETRAEWNGGIRTWLQITGEAENNFSWKINTGLEAQELQSTINNYDNELGERGPLQAANRLQSGQAFYFTQFTSRIGKLSAEASASINFNQYIYKRNYPSALNAFSRSLAPQLMPRLGVSYSIIPSLAWRIIASKGYSPPTIAEILPSDNHINSTLQPEQGWNYETGFRFHDRQEIIWWDVAAFTYRLQNAIVRRVHPDDETEFFINAGGTLQNGLESQITVQLINQQKGWIRSLKLSNAFSFSDFTFSDYSNGSQNFSGNELTGVPKQVIVTSIGAAFPSGIYLSVAYNYTSSLPLNDINTVYADAYHLLQAKIAWTSTFKKTTVSLFIGADNILNEKYSLGNDLNAVGGRYYNAAPLRSLFAGVNISTG
jgi:iron complex outermembrane receptor protein